MRNIQPVAISQYCSIRSSKRVFAKDYCDSGIPFYRSREIIEKYNGALSVSTELFISEEKFVELCAKLGAPQPGDLLLTSVGTLGVPYVVSLGERFYFKDGNLTWFCNFDGLDSTYLYYWLVSPTGKAELGKATIGSSQSAFTIVLLKDMQIKCPPLPTQRKIASILSAYDDLIENNTRRIAILEEMAQSIYREWFVNFRFPGFESVKLVDSPLGMIPEGWEVVTLGDVMSATRGLSYKGKHRNPDGIPMHNLNSVLEGGGYKYVGIKFYDGPYKPKHVVEAGDLIVTNTEQGFDRRLIGHAALIPRAFTGAGIASHHLYIVKPLENSYVTPIFLLHMLNDAHFHWGVSGFANGTTINMLPTDALAFPQFPMPPHRLLKDFTVTAEQILEQKEFLYRKNHNLRTTRDLLLPKLISGKLDVEDLDIDVIEPLEELQETTA